MFHRYLFAQIGLLQHFLQYSICEWLYFHRANATDEQNRTEIINDAIAYGIFTTITTTIQFIGGIFAVDCFNHSALRQITRIRIKFFQSLMQQEMGWYDVASGNNNFAVRITE